LGWEQVVGLDDFAVFQTRGAVFTLYQLDKLLDESGFEEGTPQVGAVTLAVNVDEPDQVNRAIDAAREAGAPFVKDPVDMDWGGRSAHFTDPEGNHWEVAYVPGDSEMAQALRDATG
jgi:hypothetical protein